MVEPVVKKPWPLAGYAPGNYSCHCVTCDQIFEGDKRAVQCLECAALSVNAILAKPEDSFRKVAAQAFWLLAWTWQSHTFGPTTTFDMTTFAPEARDMMNSGEQKLFDALKELSPDNAGAEPQNTKDENMDRNTEQEEAEISFSLINQLVADGETSVRIKATNDQQTAIDITGPWTGRHPRTFTGAKMSDALGAALSKRTEIAMSQGADGPFAAGEEIAHFLKGVVGAVEATGAEKQAMWERYCDRGKVSWEAGRGGYLPTIGMFNGFPVCISIYVDTVHGSRILFYHATSRVVDHDLINAWLDKNLPKGVKRTDATNFFNVFPNDAKPTLERD